MDQDDPSEVMMLHLEETQLFFLAHSDGDGEYTGIQMIRQAKAKL